MADLLPAPRESMMSPPPIICRPAATVRKRLPDIRWEDGRRVIWDGKFSNFPTP